MPVSSFCYGTTLRTLAPLLKYGVLNVDRRQRGCRAAGGYFQACSAAGHLRRAGPPPMQVLAEFPDPIMEMPKMLHTVKPLLLAASLVLAGLGASSSRVLAEEKKQDAPPAAAASVENGGRTFMRYCALCHGLDGTGLGPLAESLQKMPPDLTKIAERNGGTFPEAKVKEIIETGGVKSHGMMAMLAWGKVFNEEIGKDQQGRVIDELAAYLATLQGR